MFYNFIKIKSLKKPKKISTRIFVGIFAGTLLVFSISTLIDYFYSRTVLTRLVQRLAERSFRSAYHEIDSEIRPLVNNAHNTGFLTSESELDSLPIEKLMDETLSRFPYVFGIRILKYSKNNQKLTILRESTEVTDREEQFGLYFDTTRLNSFNKKLDSSFHPSMDVHLKNDTIILSYYYFGININTCVQYYARLSYFVDKLDNQINIRGSHYYLIGRDNRILRSSTTDYTTLPEKVRQKEIDQIKQCLSGGLNGLVVPKESGIKKAIYLLELKGTELRLATVFPFDEVLKRFRRFFQISFLLSIIAIIVLAYLLQKIIVRITNPISKLTDISKKIQHGSLNADIPDYHKDNESEQISSALRTVQTKMKHYVSNLNSALKEKRAMEHELQMASRIQNEMQPTPLRALKHIPDIDIYARMDAAKGVAGDFYEYFFLDEKRLFFILGDVSGKGIPAAMFMARTIAFVQIEAQRQNKPGKIFEAVNNYLTLKNDEAMFVTAIAGVIDITSGELTLCDAGHNTPLFSLCSVNFEYSTLKKNTPLGIISDREYKETTLQFSEGDSLILYSDGLTEAQSKTGKLLGEDAVEHALKEKGKSDIGILANILWNLIENFTINAPQSDDITLLILRYFGEKGACVLPQPGEDNEKSA